MIIHILWARLISPVAENILAQGTMPIHRQSVLRGHPAEYNRFRISRHHGSAVKAVVIQIFKHCIS